MEEHKNFFDEISNRLIMQFKPFNHLYLIVLVFFVLIVGGFGTWYTVWVDSDKTDYFVRVSFSMFQFCSAILATSMIDLYTNEKLVHKISFFIYGLALILSLIGLFYLFCTNNHLTSLIGSSICLIVTMVVWHLANCDNEKFNESTFNGRIRGEAREIHGNDWEHE